MLTELICLCLAKIRILIWCVAMLMSANCILLSLTACDRVIVSYSKHMKSRTSSTNVVLSAPVSGTQSQMTNILLQSPQNHNKQKAASHFLCCTKQSSAHCGWTVHFDILITRHNDNDGASELWENHSRLQAGKEKDKGKRITRQWKWDVTKGKRRSICSRICCWDREIV